MGILINDLDMSKVAISVTLNGMALVAKDFGAARYGASFRAFPCKLYDQENGALYGSYIMRDFYPKQFRDEISSYVDEKGQFYSLCANPAMDAACSDCLKEMDRQKRLFQELRENGSSGEDLERYHFAEILEDKAQNGKESTGDSVSYCLLYFNEFHETDLEQQLKNMSICQKLEVFEQLCKVVNAVHNAGLMLLDLKPSNLLAKSTDTISFLQFFDYNAMSEINEKGVCLHPYAFTESFAAPEVKNYHGMSVITVQADIYSLGKMLQYFLYGTTEEMKYVTVSVKLQMLQASQKGDERGVMTQSFVEQLNWILSVAMNHSPASRFDFRNKEGKFGAAAKLGEAVAQLKNTYQNRGVSPWIMRKRALEKSLSKGIREELLTEVNYE